MEERLTAYRRRVEELLDKYPKNTYVKYLDGIKDPDLSSRIFVQIPSYVDAEIVPTIKAMLAHAANPDRVRTYVYLQDDNQETREFLDMVDNLTYDQIDPKDSPGTCEARGICQQHLGNEDFILHLDAHTRFADFWDAALIACWKENNDPRSVISSYCFTYIDWYDEAPESETTTERAYADRVISLSAGKFMAYDEVFGRRPLTKYSDKNIEGAATSGHFLFAPAQVDRDVPYDPYTLHQSDEYPWSARLWTYGYRIYHPHVQCIFHLTRRPGNLHDIARPIANPRTPWDGSKAASARIRNKVLFGVIDEPEYLGIYGPGPVHTIGEYLNYAGLDPKQRMVRKFATEARYNDFHTAEDMELVPGQ